MKFNHSALLHAKEGWKKHQKKILISTGAITLVVLIILGGSYGYTLAHDGKIYQNITIGNIDVSGLTEAEASEAIQAAYNGMLDRGFPVRLVTDDDERLSVIDLRASGSTDPDLIYDLISVNVDKATTEAFRIGRHRDQSVVANTLDAFDTLISGVNIIPEVTLAEDRLVEAINYAFGEFEQPGDLTAYKLSGSNDDLEVEIVPGTTGLSLEIDPVILALQTDSEDFDLNEAEMLLTTSLAISEEDAENLAAEVKAAAINAPYKLSHTSPAQREFSWTIDQSDIGEWLIPVSNENDLPALALDADAMTEFFNKIREDVNVSPQNARFQIDGERVTEFAGSLDGVEFDAETTIEMLEAELGNKDVELTIAVDLIEPEITTENVNNLGITEILGIGVSNFAGSPANRISNMKHGTAKLNGLLVALKPFTIADGWLPELVIKGDEIKPEVGGGACQFGSTMFRAAMNSGLEITQRRNHSLVVSYYDDLTNGNPGTDATIYDPAPDFRFKNDTGNHILVTTEMDMEERLMIFTMWGTSDGRQGSYTPPEILSWTGYGATVTKETDALPPGVKRCQAPHSGAVTSFDYTVEYGDGEVFEHTYTSTYRSLPQVCLVGIGGGETTEVPKEDLKVDNPPAEDPDTKEEPMLENEEPLGLDDVVEEEE